MNIIFFCCEFAPEGKTGAIRPSKLAKYFSKMGCKIHVLTKEVKKPIHVDLLNDLKNVEITRIKLRKFLPINDDGFWFSIFAFFSLVKLIIKKKPDFIFVSVPVFLPMLTVLIVSKILRVKFIIDYRDLWQGDPYSEKSFKDSILRFFSKFIEPICMQSSSMTVFISEAMKRDQEALYGRIENSVVLSTGYDAEDLDLLHKDDSVDYPILNESYKYYSHVGMLDWDMNVDVLIKLIKNNINYIKYNNIKFLFVGGKNDLIIPEFISQGIYDCCNFINTVDKRNALLITKLSAGIIILGSSSSQRLNRKVFESVACNDNIFYFGNSSSPTGTILGENDCNLVFDYTFDFSIVNNGFFEFINSKNSRVEVPHTLKVYEKSFISESYYKKIEGKL